MKFIANHVNSEYFTSILTTLNKNKIDEVLCAVAYVTNKTDLFDFCYKNHLKLSFWGRYDKTIPVSLPALKLFLERGSDLYRCFLIKNLFHSKVYWFRGEGAYIGSANISENAWVKNIEAGIFFTDDELTTSGLDKQLEDFFDYLKNPKVSTMLNEDIYKEIKRNR